MRRPIRFSYEGAEVVVERNDTHPDAYLWIVVHGKRYFLDTMTSRIRTRGQVKARALEWLREHQAALGS